VQLSDVFGTDPLDKILDKWVADVSEDIRRTLIEVFFASFLYRVWLQVRIPFCGISCYKSRQQQLDWSIAEIKLCIL
jgi:hypothetical protein